MKRIIFTLISIFSLGFFAKAAVEPVKGIEPSGKLPILYINTENSTPVDQKTTYIDAEWWLVSNNYEGQEDIGSPEKPQKLGIRGRGNTTWIHNGQKPYKLKLDKKTDLLGMGKNKHWALLTRLTSYELFNEKLAFELGRKLEMPFVPDHKPVEVVLNGTYVGFYVLTESIRIDDNRLEIFEQPDENEDPEILEGGWLVELDNNVEPVQVKLPHPRGYNVLITPHTPEVLSDMQMQWLTDQFRAIIESTTHGNQVDNTWEEYIDVTALAKHLLVQEMMTNFDAYLGSCYIHKDLGGKWCFGPLWDFSYSAHGHKSIMMAEREGQKLIVDLFNQPALRAKTKELWFEFMSRYGVSWVESFLRDYKNEIKEAVAQSVKVWPDNPLDVDKGLDTVLDNFLFNMNFNNDFYSRYVVNRQISCSVVPSEKSTVKDNPPLITFNGIERYDFPVKDGYVVEMKIQPKDGQKINKVTVNGVFQNLERLEGETPVFALSWGKTFGDKNIEVYYDDLSDVTAVDEIVTDEEEYFIYYDLNGVQVDPENLSPGIYIRKSASKVEKLVIR